MLKNHFRKTSKKVIADFRLVLLPYELQRRSWRIQRIKKLPGGGGRSREEEEASGLPLLGQRPQEVRILV